MSESQRFLAKKVSFPPEIAFTLIASGFVTSGTWMPSFYDRIIGIEKKCDGYIFAVSYSFSVKLG